MPLSFLPTLPSTPERVFGEEIFSENSSGVLQLEASEESLASAKGWEWEPLLP
jgi:hypothetical protein